MQEREKNNMEVEYSLKLNKWNYLFLQNVFSKFDMWNEKWQQQLSKQIHFKGTNWWKLLIWVFVLAVLFGGL